LVPAPIVDCLQQVRQDTHGYLGSNTPWPEEWYVEPAWVSERL
jgi:hypothetical protein